MPKITSRTLPSVQISRDSFGSYPVRISALSKSLRLFVTRPTSSLLHEVTRSRCRAARNIYGAFQLLANFGEQPTASRIGLQVTFPGAAERYSAERVLNFSVLTRLVDETEDGAVGRGRLAGVRQAISMRVPDSGGSLCGLPFLGRSNASWRGAD